EDAAEVTDHRLDTAGSLHARRIAAPRVPGGVRLRGVCHLESGEHVHAGPLAPPAVTSHGDYAQLRLLGGEHGRVPGRLPRHAAWKFVVALADPQLQVRARGQARLGVGGRQARV